MAGIFGNTNSSTSGVSRNKRTKVFSSSENPDSSTPSNLSAAMPFGSSWTQNNLCHTQPAAARPPQRNADTVMTDSSTSPRISKNKRTKVCSSVGNPGSSTTSNFSVVGFYGSSGTTSSNFSTVEPFGGLGITPSNFSAARPFGSSGTTPSNFSTAGPFGGSWTTPSNFSTVGPFGGSWTTPSNFSTAGPFGSSGTTPSNFFAAEPFGGSGTTPSNFSAAGPFGSSGTTPSNFSAAEPFGSLGTTPSNFSAAGPFGSSGTTPNDFSAAGPFGGSGTTPSNFSAAGPFTGSGIGTYWSQPQPAVPNSFVAARPSKRNAEIGITNSSSSSDISKNKRTKVCSSFGTPDSSTPSNFSAVGPFESSGIETYWSQPQPAAEIGVHLGTGLYLSQEEAAARSNFRQESAAATSSSEFGSIHFVAASVKEFGASSSFGQTPFEQQHCQQTPQSVNNPFGTFPPMGQKFIDQNKPTIPSITPPFVGASLVTSSSAFGSTHFIAVSSQEFGTLPPVPQKFIGQNAGSVPPIQYELSSIPFNNFGAETQTQPTVSSITSGTSSSFGSAHFVGALASEFGSRSLFGQTQQHSQQTPQPISNPFGALQPMPHMFLGQNAGSVPPIRYEPSSAPFKNFGSETQTQPTVSSITPATSSSFGSTHFVGALAPEFGSSSLFGQTQQHPQQSPQPISNPYGTLPPIPQMFLGQSAGSVPSIQYEIPSMLANEKPAQVRTTTLLKTRRIALSSRNPVHSRRYNPKKNGRRVSFFSDGEEAECNLKADATFFIPRENPRALFIRQPEQSSPSVLKPAVNLKELAVPINDHGMMGQGRNGTQSFENDAFAKELENAKEDLPGDVEDANIHKSLLSSKLFDGPVKSCSSNKADEPAVVYEHGSLMPKLQHSDYYTEPNIEELAAKERAEPSYCRRVKNFVVGRKGYGFIKFLGETDVRQLDLQSIIEFKGGNVSVYENESKIPSLGKGLNKPAEVTLLNINCLDKKTRQRYTEGVEVDKFERILKRKNKKQGAEFMSYNALKGEWKFSVKQFSKLGLDESKVPSPQEDLNKQAEMTLLNDKHVDQYCMKGVEVEEFEKRLKRKPEDLGEEFLSSNVVKGELKSCAKRQRKDGLYESGFSKMWINLREWSMEYLKSKIWN